uniref:CSON012054 protein n=1 Tax=Culicoides sonorensis TaxID=179676 RepID=A0A336M4H3_CULSO
MSFNETLLLDDPELIDLINETNAAVDKLNLVTAKEDYEKKCHIIFTELEKDLAAWSKHINTYLEKPMQANQLEEGLKYDLIKRLDLKTIGKDIKSFESRLKQLEELFNENIKVSCAELISNEELGKLNQIEEFVEGIQDQLSDVNDAFRLLSEDNKEAVKCAKILQKSQNMLENFKGLESQMNKIQRKIIKNCNIKLELEEN